MKYIKQFLIIIGFSFAGELLHRFIPLPIPASIYGMVLMFTALCTGVLKLSAVKETGKFLTDMMPVMFIPVTAALMDSWDILRSSWPVYLFITFATTVIVMSAAGFVTQAVMRSERRKDDVR